MPPVTLALLISNGLLFLLQMVYGDALIISFGLWPLGNAALELQGGMSVPEFAPWQLITYGFLHGSIGHLFFNMLALWMFGAALEQAWGSNRYAVFVLTGIIGAGVAQLIFAAVTHEPYPTVGASGGVYAVLLGFGMMFPNRMVLLLIPPIPMKAKYLVLIFGAMELFFGITGTQQGVAHFAHLGGMVTGYFLILKWRRDYERRIEAQRGFD
ncbi:MAG: rhomboid family intramembrane serine protease [Xanthomonadales bacterium]|nr:rhomboid family intramembrane serine protease [Xanthomonadales bacterium]MCB1642271.1 rhomboid family intramembrane serine protease [Xanthomonadales bacterium]